MPPFDGRLSTALIYSVALARTDGAKYVRARLAVYLEALSGNGGNANVLASARGALAVADNAIAQLEQVAEVRRG